MPRQAMMTAKVQVVTVGTQDGFDGKPSGDSARQGDWWCVVT